MTEPPKDEPYHVGLLRQHLAGRRVVLALDVLVSCAGFAPRLLELGVGDVLLVAGSRGTGHIDAEVERDAILLGTRGRDLMSAIRAFEAALDDPPQDLRDAVERFDPDGEALVVTTMFRTRQTLCGREVFGRREPAWTALEDKTTIDVFWDAAGVPRAPSAIVPVELPRLRSAAERLDQGLGTVWVADNREGWHGGASGLRWVRTPDDAEVAAEDLGRIADVVRVMPFLEGRPCSIHGWVIGDEVIASRPCEAVLLREVGGNRLWYGGAGATSWKPDEATTADMRTTARRVGEYLRDTIAYRGVFTVDGVLTADGFRPTELNPRFGAAIATLGRGAGLPLYLLHCLSIEVPDLDWRAAEIEQALLDGQSMASAFLILDGHTDVAERALRVIRDGDRRYLVEVDPDAPADQASADGDGASEANDEGSGEADGDVEVARVELGPGPTGAFLRIELTAHPDGAAVAPVAAELLPWVGEHLGIELPRLEAAPDLR
jgi:hypothetical protein